ncbi:MAG: hypothetical protein AAFY11_13075 [Cyanobacteria bacterium J06641_5]
MASDYRSGDRRIDASCKNVVQKGHQLGQRIGFGQAVSLHLRIDDDRNRSALGGYSIINAVLQRRSPLQPESILKESP